MGKGTPKIKRFIREIIMRKTVAAMNMTLDGFCDHTAMNPGDEVHRYFNELLRSSDVVLYGWTTYKLMEYWRGVVKNPTGNKIMDEFAVTMDTIPKIVFTHTPKQVDWKSARITKQNLNDEILALKQQPGKDILIGSPSLIVQCTKLNLVDEYQIVVHPIILGNGLSLFKNITDRVDLKLFNTKSFGCGAITLYFERK